MAGYGLKGVGFFLCSVIAAPTGYVVTSLGAAEKARLGAVERQIAQARADIRELETEFDYRASLGTLEQLNREVLALGAPAADQFLHDAAALASLDPMRGAIGDAAVYRMSGSSRPAPPVEGAVMTVSQPLPVDRVSRAIARSEAGRAMAAAQPAAAGASPKPASRAATVAARTARDAADTGEVVVLDRALLADATLADLLEGAGAETAAR